MEVEALVDTGSGEADDAMMPPSEVARRYWVTEELVRVRLAL